MPELKEQASQMVKHRERRAPWKSGGGLMALNGKKSWGIERIPKYPVS